MSSLPVVFRSGLYLQQAEVTGEKPAFHSRQEKASGKSWPGKDKHGLKTEVNWLLAFAHWEKESGHRSSLHPSEHGAVCGSSWGDPSDSFWRCISSLEKDEKSSSNDSKQQYSQTRWCSMSLEPGPAPRWGVGAGVPGQHMVHRQRYVPRATLETARCGRIAVKQLFSLAQLFT